MNINLLICMCHQQQHWNTSGVRSPGVPVDYITKDNDERPPSLGEFNFSVITTIKKQRTSMIDNKFSCNKIRHDIDSSRLSSSRGSRGSRGSRDSRGSRGREKNNKQQ